VALDWDVDFIHVYHRSTTRVCYLVKSCHALNTISVMPSCYYVVCMFLGFMKVDLEIYGTGTFAPASIVSLFTLFIVEFVSFQLLIQMGIGFVQWRFINVLSGVYNRDTPKTWIRESLRMGQTTSA
jgi:hypothetical protein